MPNRKSQVGTKANSSTKDEATQSVRRHNTNTIVSGSEFETMERWCPNCKQITTQYVKLYNPDNPEDGEVWECHYCEENTGWAS